MKEPTHIKYQTLHLSVSLIMFLCLSLASICVSLSVACLVFLADYHPVSASVMHTLVALIFFCFRGPSLFRGSHL